MTKSLHIFALTIMLFGAAAGTHAQTTQSPPQPPPQSPSTRPRIVANPSAQTPVNNPRATSSPTPTPTPRIYTQPSTPTSTPNASPTPAMQTSPAQPTTVQVITIPNPLPMVVLQPLAPVTPAQIRARLEEAKRILRARVQPTALGAPATDYVMIAAFEPVTNVMHTLTLQKILFLSRGADVRVTTSQNLIANVRIVRANGVNTAVQIYDLQGRQLVPVIVQYPIEKFGYFREMAYYSSVHPTLLSPEIVRDGKAYVRAMVDQAAKRLRDKGVFVSPQIVDIAERLCIVEHVDHDRFRRESRGTIYDEIHALYALNLGNTYNYSVSTAGAGGMVQMIAPTYQMVRNRHPNAGLMPDFVAGMRNHPNAVEAMLLYMQDTWNDMASSSEVTYALSAKLATQAELMSAGYNSNPARLPLYLRRGGAGWRTLIPRETQMYLQIYRSVESLVPRVPRAPVTMPTPATTTIPPAS